MVPLETRARCTKDVVQVLKHVQLCTKSARGVSKEPTIVETIALEGKR